MVDSPEDLECNPIYGCLNAKVISIDPMAPETKWEDHIPPATGLNLQDALVIMNQLWMT